MKNSVINNEKTLWSANKKLNEIMTKVNNGIKKLKKIFFGNFSKIMKGSTKKFIRKFKAPFTF